MKAENNEDPILEEIVAMIVEVVGEEFTFDLEITPETAFNDDLALESIEFVALAEKLNERYGEQVNFAEFLAGKEILEIMALTVGDLVSYIRESLSRAAISASPQ